VETIAGEHLMITLIPAICCLFAFVGMLFYPLSDKKVKEVTIALQEQRAKQ
jgi:GPH family glycoside/pentoside/hexuronide:cation symporter